MKFYITKTPKIIQKLFSDYIWKIDTGNKEIYLTFDDGPIPEITPWVLNTLEKYNAKATFFCVGNNIKKHLQIFQEILEQDHSVGNHTFNHLQGWKTDAKKYVKNVDIANELISNLKLKEKREERREEIHQLTTNNQQPSTKLFRPPYGKIKSSQAKELLKKNYQIIMWDVLSGDFDKNLSKEKCLENIIKNTNKGSIVVFHDSEKAFENLKFVLPKTLEYFSEKGFIFKAL